MEKVKQLTLKGEKYEVVGRPPENKETQWWRCFLVKIIFGLYNEKKETLSQIGWQPQPITQAEIFREKCRRVAMLKEAGAWGNTKEYPYKNDHEHNWIERRVNECATEQFGPRIDGKVAVINTTAGKYEPNPKLFK